MTRKGPSWSVPGLVGVALWMFSTLWAQQADSQKLGKEVFEKACVKCHGSEGHGDGPEIRRLGFFARDFSLGAFKCRCTSSGSLPTDEDLLRSVSEGLPGSPMPSHEREFSLEERKAVVQFIKTLSLRFSREEPGPCLSIPEPPRGGPGLVAEGQQIYRLLSCASCHGDKGRGDGPAAAQLTDSWGKPIKVHKFAILRKFKCGNRVQDLYRTLHTGLNGTPMPSYTEAFLFAGDSWADASAFERSLGPAEVQELKSYVETQPDTATISQMPEATRQGLIEHRTWALVYFLKSLAR